MTFRKRLQYFLVKKLSISNKLALMSILEGKVKLNGLFVFENLEIEPHFEIIFEDKIIQKGKELLYFAYHKPRGIETTMNLEIADNLADFLPAELALFPVGRLDKDSEGLLILTNDGTIYDKILRKEFALEKEYEVVVDQEINTVFLAQMVVGVVIMGKKTLPCEIFQSSENSFRIVLIQGLNNQIRRMCYKLGFKVLQLKRVRIGAVFLSDLAANQRRAISKAEIFNVSK